MTKKLSVDYTQFGNILKADVVRVYDLVNFFKKEDIDYDEYGNIFIGFNKKSAGLPILVAHTDNVLGADKTPVFDLSCRYLRGVKNGIGFDDKAGIMAIITLWQYFKEQKFRIIFPANEEVGGVGSENMLDDWFVDAKWILELDRKGDKDFIQTSGGVRLCSDSFAQKFIDMGFKKAEGVFTDVNVFKPRANWVNMANLSIGYYEPHTDKEYLDTVAFEKIINKVAQFIEKDYDFEDDKPDPEPTYKSSNDWYWNTDKTSRTCANCGGVCDKGMIYNQYGERFCCRDCMEEYAKDLETYGY